jgi:type I restriction enzyme S subunit
MYASVGQTATLGIPAVWNQAILGLSPLPGRADPRFLGYWLESIKPAWSALFRSNTQDNLNAEVVGNAAFPGLSMEVQRATADYLDAETARIDALVQRRLLQVGLLGQRRASMLATAFSSAAHRTYRLKDLVAQRPCYGVLVPRFAESGTMFIRVNDLLALGGGLPEAQIERSQSEEYRRTIVHAGDVLLSVVGSVDKAAVVPTTAAGANVARAVCRLVPSKDVAPELLELWLQSQEYLDQAHVATSGDTAQPTLNMSDLASFRVDIPPPESRRTFLADLQSRLAKAEEVLAKAQAQIALLRERRQALITAAVTGRIEMPGVAA